jgi:hypothetical protein
VLAVILVGLSAGLGLLSTLVVVDYGGLVTLGIVTKVNGLIGVLQLPSTFLTLAVAQWSSQHRYSLGQFTRIYVASGLAGVLYWAGLFVFRHPLFSFVGAANHRLVIPAVLGGVPMFALPLSYGFAQGNRKYVWMSGFALIPAAFKLGCLIITAVVNLRLTPSGVLWAGCVSAWLASVVAMNISAGWTRDHKIVESQTTVWASGWTSVGITSWLTADTALAGHVLTAVSMGIFAVMTAFAKIMFHVMSAVGNISIGERSNPMNTRVLQKLRNALAIIGVGGGWILWQPVIGRLFGIHYASETHFGLIFAAYLLVMVILGFSYLESGQQARSGQHGWIGLFVGLTIWGGLLVLKVLPGQLSVFIGLALPCSVISYVVARVFDRRLNHGAVYDS